MIHSEISKEQNHQFHIKLRELEFKCQSYNNKQLEVNNNILATKDSILNRTLTSKMLHNNILKVKDNKKLIMALNILNQDMLTKIYQLNNHILEANYLLTKVKLVCNNTSINNNQ